MVKYEFHRRVALSGPGGRIWRQGRTRAQMLKAEATGPRVPAIRGKAEAANHQRLGRARKSAS